MKNLFYLKLFAAFVAMTALLICLSLILGAWSLPSFEDADAPVTDRCNITVIIDAGHGGEDGGASSTEGLVEKDVNLDIANMLCDMLKANGTQVIMTRNDDRLLYDRNTDYKGRKKKLDLAARLAIANESENAVFISIHMNSFTDPKYSGLQVWYSPRVEGSSVLAQMIQEKNRLLLQSENTRKIKAATSSIYLLDNATVPSVLIECGFLSNPDEAKLFESEEYKQKVAFVIFCSISEYLTQGS